MHLSAEVHDALQPYGVLLLDEVRHQRGLGRRAAALLDRVLEDGDGTVYVPPAESNQVTCCPSA